MNAAPSVEFGPTRARYAPPEGKCFLLAEPLKQAIRGLSNNRYGKCFASARGLTKELYRTHGIKAHINSIRRAVRRLAKRGEIGHKTYRTNQVMVTGEPSKRGGQANWILSRSDRREHKRREKMKAQRQKTPRLSSRELTRNSRSTEAGRRAAELEAIEFRAAVELAARTMPGLVNGVELKFEPPQFARPRDTVSSVDEHRAEQRRQTELALARPDLWTTDDPPD